MSERIRLCATADVPEGRALVVPYRSMSIGIFRVGQNYHALLNLCPHKGAALCEGRVAGTSIARDVLDIGYARSGEILRCAWHGWEFDIRTGICLVDPKLRARVFAVEEEDGSLFALA